VAVSKDKNAVALLASCGKVREAVAEVVLQLPAWALSSRACALLAYGLTRSCGVDKKLLRVKEKSVRVVVAHLADVAERQWALAGSRCSVYLLY
jgi:hypothetical protein